MIFWGSQENLMKKLKIWDFQHYLSIEICTNKRKNKNFMFNNTNENHVFTWKYLQMESVLWSEGKTSSSSFDLFPQLVEWDAAPLFTLRPSLVKIFG